jgi:hypothetical protein
MMRIAESVLDERQWDTKQFSPTLDLSFLDLGANPDSEMVNIPHALTAFHYDPLDVKVIYLNNNNLTRMYYSDHLCVRLQVAEHSDRMSSLAFRSRTRSNSVSQPENAGSVG